MFTTSVVVDKPGTDGGSVALVGVRVGRHSVTDVRLDGDGVVATVVEVRDVHLAMWRLLKIESLLIIARPIQF